MSPLPGVMILEKPWERAIEDESRRLFMRASIMEGLEYLGVELDKTVRGKVMWAGLSEDVIEYGANDVKYLENVWIREHYLSGKLDGVLIMMTDANYVK